MTAPLSVIAGRWVRDVGVAGSDLVTPTIDFRSYPGRWYPSYSGGECQDSCRPIGSARSLAASACGFRTTTSIGFQLRVSPLPAFRVCTASPLVEFVAAGQDVLFPTIMPLVGRDITDRAVAMLGVVPIDKASDPMRSGGEVCKGQPWISRGVFEGSEQRLGVGLSSET
jgi:hypothetical protein